MTEPTAAADLERVVRSALRRRLQLARTEDHERWDDEAVAVIMAAADAHLARAAGPACQCGAASGAAGDGEPGEEAEPTGDDGGGEGKPRPERPARQPSRRGAKAAVSGVRDVPEAGGSLP